MILILFTRRAYVQAYQYLFFIRQVTDDLTDWFGYFFNQGWNGQYLVAFGQLRVHQQVDNFDNVVVFEVCLAVPLSD